MKVLGFLVSSKGGRDRGVKRSKTIRAAGGGGVPASLFRPSTDTRETDDEGPFFDLIFPVSLYGEKEKKQRSLTESESESETEFNDLFFKSALFSLNSSSEIRSERRILDGSSKFRVFKLGSKKLRSKSESESKTEGPLFSLFQRDNSSRSSNSARSLSSKLYLDFGSPCQEEKKLSSHAIQKYLSKIKPFYVKVSRGFGEKLVTRRLRKSRSASSVAAVRSPAAPVFFPGRRDDSLVEKEDGIQGAIAHCKRSFNNGEAPLVRSRSDPGEGKRVTI
ncbi:hypothetical protein LUZ60_008466 [Juncus effusus]|nr:hypothetical protein LUZ60_008466 [Juncus effusus]